MRETRDANIDQLLLMLEAAEEIGRYMEGRGIDAFEQDRVLQLAIQKLVQNIGEAATRLTPTFRRAHSHIPWSNITGMRHRLVHEFNAVDRFLLWDTAVNNVPALIRELERILADDRT